MKRLLILLSVGVGVFVLSACADGEEVTTAVEQFCMDNPNALVCENPSAERDDIVADMINTILLEFVTDANANFCTDYFADSTLVENCQTDMESLVPSDVETLSTDWVVNVMDATDEFEVLTYYEDDTPAYRFVVKVTEDDGVLKFHTFTYEVLENEATLDLSEMEIKVFMTEMINAYDDTFSYCDEYFTLNGQEDCLLGNATFSIYLMNNPVVSFVNNQTYLYTVQSYDGLDEVTYTVTFVIDDMENVLIDGISYTHNPMYNTLTNVSTMMRDIFAHQFNRDGGGTYNACNYTLDDGGTDCRDTLNQFTGETLTIGSVENGTTEGTFDVVLLFETASIDVVVSMVIDEYHVYYLDIDWEDVSNNDDPPTPVDVLSFENVFATLEYMYEEYYSGSFVCDEYFTNTLVNVCESNMDLLFHTLEVNHMNLQQIGDYHYIVHPENHNGEWDGYTHIYPSYEIGVIDVSGSVMIDYIDIFSVPTYTDFASLIDDYMGYMLNPAYTNETICNWVSYFEDSNPFFADKTCETWRQSLLDDLENTSYEFLMGPNPYGLEIPILRIEQNESIMDFEVTLQYESSSYFAVNTMWYIMYPIPVTQEEVAIVVADFETDLLNTSISNTDFCNVYDLGDDCESWRNDLLSATSATVNLLVDTSVDGSVNYMIEVVVDGTTSVYEIEVDKVDGSVVISSITKATSCTCPPCDECVCDSSLLVHNISNEALWELFLELYNDMSNTDQYLLDTFFGGESNALIDMRSSLTQEIMELVSAKTKWLEEEYVDAYATLSMMSEDHVTIFNINYQAFVVDEDTYHIVIATLDVTMSMNLTDARALFQAYLVDFLDVTISNEALQSSYLSVVNDELFTNRIDFIDQGGAIEFGTVVLGNGVFIAKYSETVGGVTTMYAHTFFADEDGKMVFYDKEQTSLVITEPTFEETVVILQNMFDDLADESITDLMICAQYYGGLEGCPWVNHRTVDAFYYMMDIEVITEENMLRYHVVYAMQLYGDTYQIDEELKVQQKSDGTFLVQSLSKTTVLNETHNFGYGSEELLPALTYIETYFLEYFDNTIGSQEFCVKHNYVDQYMSYLFDNMYNADGYIATYHSDCMAARDHNFSLQADLEIVNVEFSTYGYHHDGTRTYVFNVISRGYYALMHDNSMNDDSNYLYTTYIQVIPNRDAVEGYQSIGFTSLLANLSWLIKESNVDDFVASEVAYLTSGVSSTEICARYDVTLPGHDCFVQLASIDGFAYVGYDYTIGTRYPNSDYSDMVLPIDIALSYEDLSTGFLKVITLPINVGGNYSSTNNTYELATDPATLDIQYNVVRKFLNYETLLAQVNAYVVGYFNTALTNGEFIALYQNGDDSNGESTFLRDYDLATNAQPVLVDISLSPLMNYGLPENLQYLNLILEHNGITYMTVLLYVEPYLDDPGYFLAKSPLTTDTFDDFVLETE